MKQEDRSRLLRAQKKRHNDWAPFPSDGRCHYCGADIIALTSEQRLLSEAITGCPSCHRSFVE